MNKSVEREETDKKRKQISKAAVFLRIRLPELLWSECEQRYAPTSKEKCRHNQFSYYYFFCVKCVIKFFLLFSSLFDCCCWCRKMWIFFFLWNIFFHLLLCNLNSVRRERCTLREVLEDWTIIECWKFLFELRDWGNLLPNLQKRNSGERGDFNHPPTHFSKTVIGNKSLIAHMVGRMAERKKDLQHNLNSSFEHFSSLQCSFHQ